MAKPEKDHSKTGPRIAAAILLGLQLATNYQISANKIEKMNLDLAEVVKPIRSDGPSFLGPGKKNIVLKSFEALKKENEERGENLENFKEQMKWAGEKLEKKKTEMREAYRVPVKMEVTPEGNRIRTDFDVRQSFKVFDFGGFYVRYT
jgi:hypothetical protein